MCPKSMSAQMALLSVFARDLFNPACFCSRSIQLSQSHSHSYFFSDSSTLLSKLLSRYILNMVSPYLATVQDEDIHGNTIENTKLTAQRTYRTPSGSYTWNRSTPKPVAPNTFIEGKVASKGPLERMVRAFSTDEHPLTIFTSTQDLSEADNTIEGCGFRKVFFRGKFSFCNIITMKCLFGLTVQTTHLSWIRVPRISRNM